MHAFIDFIWVILFFVAYFAYANVPVTIINSINHVIPVDLVAGKSDNAIYFATLIAMISFAIILMAQCACRKKVSRMQWVTLILLFALGGATLALKDPTFIKWKPTVVNWLFALVFFASGWIGERPLVERLMGSAVTAPHNVWKKLNIAWVFFFVLLGALNLYVAYQFSEEFWVKVKSFGFLGLTVVFVIFQTVYLSRFITAQSKE